MKIRSKMMTMTAVLGILALGATTALGQVIVNWTGSGDGINWSDTGNWDGDATLGDRLELPSGSESTVDVDTSAWLIGTTTTSNRWIQLANDTVVLNVIAGSNLKTAWNGGAQLRLNGGTLRQTGGTVDSGNRVTAINGGLIEVSGGSYSSMRWTYDGSGGPHRLHIIGSEATLVRHYDYMSPSQDDTIQRFTLDAGGVTPHTFGFTNVSTGRTSTIQVDGIADYLAGTGNVGDVILLNVYTKTPPSWWWDTIVVEGGTGWVDGGLGFVTVNDTYGDFGAATLTIIPEPGTIALLGLAGLVMLIRRRFVK